MGEDPSPETDAQIYGSLLEANRSLPITIANLQLAQHHRIERLRLYAAGSRLAGFEQLLRILRGIDQGLRTKTELASIRYLVVRLRDDFVTELRGGW
jgi:hypothetical protein